MPDEVNQGWKGKVLTVIAVTAQLLPTYLR